MNQEIPCSLILEAEYHDLLIMHAKQLSKGGKITKKQHDYINNKLAAAKFTLNRQPPANPIPGPIEVTLPPSLEEKL